jgi:hypothetical protein|tara:strand:- start:242 stop:442 length:201 start_codon:yes stop_codon:yes gene_type:complete
MNSDQSMKSGDICDYTIITGFEPHEVENAVKAKISEGWEPFGSITFFQFEPGMTPPILQPMIKKVP